MLREEGGVRSNRAPPTNKIKAYIENMVIAIGFCPTLCPTKVSVQLLFLAFDYADLSSAFQDLLPVGG